MNEFSSINPDDKHIDEMMPLLIGIGSEKDLHAYGTCFIISQNMAMTAKHVLQELLNKDKNLAKGQPSRFEYWIVQVQWNNDEHNYVVWHLDSFSLSPHSDLAVLWLRPMNDVASDYKFWKVQQLNLAPPNEGEEVIAFGIHNVRFDGSHCNSEGKFEHVQVQTDKSKSKGLVRELYWSGRDKGLYNFPCFEIEAEFKSGMSGGFVLNSKSEICGIVCGSLPAYTAGDVPVSYACMLWPMIAIGVNKNIYKTSSILRDLIKLDHLSLKNWDKVLIDENYDPTNPKPISYNLN